MQDPLVAILLCTLNGAQFLSDQLDSINRQWHRSCSLWVSDDGSSDDTLDLVSQFRLQGSHPIPHMLDGPRRGHTANFLSLVCNPGIEGDFFAYADQDDVWEAEKLSRAVSALQALPSDTPSLYCARTRAVTIEGRPAGLSPLFKRPPSFANALLQNIGGGNTMVMNRAARDLLATAGELPVVSHDWWTYLLVTANGGNVVYDPRPSLQYRQHTGNLIGANKGLRARIRRTHRALQNRSRDWNTTNIAALNEVRQLITPPNLLTLDQFARARDRSLLPRLSGISDSGVYTQTFIGNMGLLAAATLKKI